MLLQRLRLDALPGRTMTVRQMPTLSPKGGLQMRVCDCPASVGDDRAVRALVISDTHFGAWTGRDLLREELFLERLAPPLEGIDELIFLGDLFDFLFGSVGDAVDASDGLLRLIAEKLPGKRLVFLAGNHDHHLVHRDAENRLEAQLAVRPHRPTEPRRSRLAGDDPDRPGPGFFRSFLARRLPGVEVEIAYPTYSFAGVLCTHGHYLDPHARLAGSRGDRLLTRTLWAIATGGPEQPKTIEDYESVITLLTEWLYIAAQMPHGTHAQQNVFRAVQRAGRIGSLSPPCAAPSASPPSCATAGSATRRREGLPSEEHFDAVVRAEASASAASSRCQKPPGRAPPTRPPASSRPAIPPSTRSRPSPRSSRTSAGARRATRSSSPTPTSRSPASSPAATRAPATGTPAPGSTSPTSARARPTLATCATPGRAPRS